MRLFHFFAGITLEKIDFWQTEVIFDKKPGEIKMNDSYNALIEKSLTLILDRFESSRNPYGFIDTKFNIVTGADFTGGEPHFRKDFIFGWIQGRALESLAKHEEYFAAGKRYDLCRRIHLAMEKLCRKLEDCRRRHHRISFAMTPDGAPLGNPVEKSRTFADLFYGKGLLCAAAALHDKVLLGTAQEILQQVFNDIEAETFVSGQQSFDPKNPASDPSPEKVSEGPRMIALGALADLIKIMPEKALYAAKAAEYINFILDNHTLESGGKLCFFEDIHREKRTPFAVNGYLLCDPGHGLEFTGLAGRVLRMMKAEKLLDGELFHRSAEMLPQIFIRLFDLGFQKSAGGIVKSADAVTGEILNSDMPWWSLPETIRAAREVAALFPAAAGEVLPRAAAAANAFELYIQANGFACQTRDAAGRIVNVIPACPDADPGYHTNLCLMGS